MKSEPVAVTTQEAVDGHSEKAMRIAGQVLRWARRSNLAGGVSLRKADGWNVKNHSHLTVAGHLREKTHSSMLVVTNRKDEERGICSAALRLLRIVKDQIEERSVVVIVSNRESAIWRNASVKIVLQENQLKYVDVEGNESDHKNRCIAVQTMSDKVENVVMDGSKVGEFGKFGREQNLKRIVMNGVKSGKADKVKNVVMNGVRTEKSWKIGRLQNLRGDVESK